MGTLNRALAIFLAACIASIPATATTIDNAVRTVNIVANPSSVLTEPTETISATVTTPVASPGVVNWTGSNMVAGEEFTISGGTLPTGLVAGTVYYVIATGLTANAFELAATPGGSAINFTVSSSGTQTGVKSVAQNSLLASSATAGSITVPSVTVARTAGGNFNIPRIRLSTSATAGWAATAFTVNLWTTAPTYTYGTRGQYIVATGMAGHVASFNVLLTQGGDGASGEGVVSAGWAANIALASGQSLYWDLEYTGPSTLTPVTGQTFTLTAEVQQN